MFLINIADIFSGEYRSKNEEIKAFKDELLNIDDIPTPRTDKENLRNDLNVFLKDTRKAVDTIKEELTYG